MGTDTRAATIDCADATVNITYDTREMSLLKHQQSLDGDQLEEIQSIVKASVDDLLKKNNNDINKPNWNILISLTLKPPTHSNLWIKTRLEELV